MSKPYWNPIETAPREELEALQLKRLQDTVRRVYENVPFYREKFDQAGVKPEDIRSLKDLAKLPFTYKQDLRDNYPYGLLAVPLEQVTRIQATSGTTGKQTVVGYTDNDLQNVWGEVTARALTAAGADQKDVVHVSYGYGLFTGGLGLHQGAQAIHATTIPVSSGNTKRQVQILQDLGSTVLCCTPSYAMYIGETVRDMGISPDDLNLRIGVFGAEPWTPKMRAQIEELLGIEAFDIYGLCEVIGPGVSMDCRCHNGMHINEDHFLPEIIDPDTGEVLSEGAEGELVFTCITKEALPLIRYRTRDICTLTYEKCECGRTLVRMSKPRGRTDDMLIIRGVNVFPSQIESVILSTKGITPNYMIEVDRVNNTDTIEVSVEVAPDFEFDVIRLVEEKQRQLETALQQILNISVKVNLVGARTLERSEGKAKRVIDRRKLHD